MTVRKITDIFAEKSKTYSFEFFPPKTDKGRETMYNTATELMKLNPDYFTVTYGAGGSTSKATMEIVAEMQKRFDIPVMHHFTCVKHTISALRHAIGEMKRAGICNILALKGDPPANEPNYKPGPEEPRFGYELIKLIREQGDHFAIGVAGFPEGHINTPTKELDSKYLKIKQDAGADFVVTQLFFDNTIYYEFVDRVRKEGVTMRLLPGILTITDYAGLQKFCSTCGATIPQFIRDMFEPIANDPEATLKKGIEFAIKQCQDLLDHGSPGLHFFCLNKVEPTATVYKALKR